MAKYFGISNMSCCLREGIRCEEWRDSSTLAIRRSPLPSCHRPLSGRSREAHRNRKGEHRAHSHLALDPDPSAVKLDELPRQSEPEPGALVLGRTDPDLTELLEHGFLVLRRDADPGVADRHLHGSVYRHRPDLHLPAFRRELDGVRQQI